MKKITALILITVMTLSLLAACGKVGSGVESLNGESTDARGEESATAGETETVTTEEAGSGTAEATESEKSDADAPIRPLLWKVTDGDGRTLYLFGTMHAGDERSCDMLEAVDKTLSSCDSLAVEFDSDKYLSDTVTIASDMQKFMYTDGSKITDHISADLYNKMKDALEGAGIYSPLYDWYKPSMWSQLLETAYLGMCPLSTDFSIDSMLTGRAKALGMSVLDVESGSFQMDLLASFPDELNILLIESSLGYSYDEYSDGIIELYEAWLAGDAEKIEELSSETDEELSEEEQALIDDYNYKMLDERNLGMAGKAKEYIKSGRTVFFAVGSAHMVGDAGIVSQLTEDGYTVERINPIG